MDVIDRDAPKSVGPTSWHGAARRCL